MRTSLKTGWSSLGVAALLSLTAAAAMAQGPQSDDFKTGIGKQWLPMIRWGNTSDFSAKAAGGVLTLHGAGADLWQGTDSAELLPQKVSGNFDMVLQTLSVPTCSGWSSTGLMVRQDDSENQPNWFRISVSNTNGVEMKGGGAGATRGSTIGGLKPPYWTRLQRINLDGKTSLLTGWTGPSKDGPWTLVRQDTLDLTDPVLAGIDLQTHCGDTPADSTTGPFISNPVPPGGILQLNLTLKGKVDSNGNPVTVNNQYVSVQQNGKEVANATTDGGGQAFVLGVPDGAVKIVVNGLTTEAATIDASSKTGSVTKVPIVLNQLPQAVDLSSDAGQKWELQVPAKDSKEDPNKVATDPAKDFQSYPVPGDWASDVLTGGAGDNTDAWYRTKVTVPASFVGKDLVLANWNMDDVDYTYWNGQFIGSTAQWDAKRRYVIPGNLVKASNDLVILNHNGGGGAGISQSAPVLISVNPSATISGQVVDQKGNGVGGITVEAKSQGVAGFGPADVMTSTSPGGNYFISGIGAGTYVVSIASAPTGSVVPDPSKPMDVKAGQTQQFNLTLNVPVPIGTMSLRAKDLPAGKGWKFLGQVEVDNGPDKDKSRDLIEKNADKYGALNYTDTGKDSILTNATWISDWPYVPGDAGPDGRAGTPGGIPDNTDWVNRIHFTLTGDMDKGERYEVTQFNTDDNVVAAYINGVKVSGYLTGWDVPRTMILPANAINHGGKDNVFTLIGNEGGGGAGFNKDLGGPNLIALAAVASVTPTVKVGDVTGDGKVNIADATTILQFAVKLKTPTADQLKAADINHDGVIDIKDVTLLLKAIVSGTVDQLK